MNDTAIVTRIFTKWGRIKGAAIRGMGTGFDCVVGKCKGFPGVLLHVNSNEEVLLDGLDFISLLRRPEFKDGIQTVSGTPIVARGIYIGVDKKYYYGYIYKDAPLIESNDIPRVEFGYFGRLYGRNANRLFNSVS